MAEQLAAGTPITDALSGYTHYTAEQLEALEAMKDRAYTFGIARAEFANTVLLPDGTHVPHTEDMVGAAVAAAKAAVTDVDFTDPAVLKAATRAAEVVKEIAAHDMQNRFLFIVGQDGLPVIYFQCATPDNPEAMTALSPHANDFPVLVADHVDQEAFAAQATEVAARIAKTIADARAAAKET